MDESRDRLVHGLLRAAQELLSRGDRDDRVGRQRNDECLDRLNGILRPILRREWASMVAAMSGLPESRLEEFLFGAARIPLDEVRGPLREMQAGRCFYCDDALRGATEVDHFIPWARYPDNGLDNLVVAHDRCTNGSGTSSRRPGTSSAGRRGTCHRPGNWGRRR